MDKYIPEAVKEFIKNFECNIYPNTYIPIYQVLTAIIFGLLFGPYHNAFIWSLLSYGIFEYILYLATRKRHQLYKWRWRFVAIFCSILATLFSKYIWRNPKIPMFKIFN